MPKTEPTQTATRSTGPDAIERRSKRYAGATKALPVGVRGTVASSRT